MRGKIPDYSVQDTLQRTVYVLGMYSSFLHIKLCRSILPCTWEWDGSFMLTACRRPAGIIKYRNCSDYMWLYSLPKYLVDWQTINKEKRSLSINWYQYPLRILLLYSVLPILQPPDPEQSTSHPSHLFGSHKGNFTCFPKGASSVEFYKNILSLPFL